jgi:PKD repeat protein
MKDDPGQFPYFIPIVWQGDGPNPSPNYSARGSMYGVGGIPHCQWGGSQSVIGGGGSTYGSYVTKYNQISAQDSPVDMELSLGTNASGQFVISADVELTGNISTTNNKIVFILTYDFTPDQTPDYFASAITYGEQTFDLSTSGQTGYYEEPVTYNPAWDLTKLKALAIVQTFSGNHEIHQAGITEYTGLLPMFASNVTEGPAYLGVQFTNNSFPASGIDSWEWDFDGDGVFDSTQENPYHIYTEPGEYDVTLKIEVDGEFAEITVVGYITATDGSSVSGTLSGAWLPEFNPYVITGDIDVAVGNQLSIQPGVEIQFDADVQLNVNGLLVADASSTRSDPIVFTSDSSWGGIRFFNTLEDNLLANCEISNATISAILVEGDSRVDVIGCKIYDNNTTSLAAAIEVVGSDNVLVSQNIIANNTSTSNSGAITCTASIIEISNNIVVNNTGQWGAFSFKNDSNSTLTNNTIANNLSSNTTPYLMFLLNSVPVISNSIIIDNGEVYFPQSTPDITYSCVTGGFTGEGNIDEDPLFVAATEGDGTDYDGLLADWILQTGSLCIDAGNPDAIYNDVDGSRNDMGAYGGPTPCEFEPTDSEENTVSIAAVNSISVYPNPFNPTANIALSINENDIQQPVSVEIFNVKGQLVKTIVNNEVVQTTNFVWNGKDNNGNSTSSGMYFVKLQTATSEVSKKMLLLK